jgi:hypothetical protein
MAGQTLDEVVVTAGEVAAVHPLDLDDVGAELGQVPRAERGRDRLLDRDHQNAGEWAIHTGILGPLDLRGSG